MLQVVTDSSCDLPRDLLERNGIMLVPVPVTIDGETYLEGVDLTTREFYDKMTASPTLPRTAQPSPGVFAEVFRRAAERGPVICLTVSSKLSGTHASACLGRDLSGVDVSVFDTLSASLGHGLQVLHACDLARAGHTASEALAKLQSFRDQANAVVLLNTLENVVKGGRLNKTQGTLSKLLNIRVLLYNNEGDVALLEKVHGSKKLMHRALDFIQSKRATLSGRDVGITHFDNLADVETLQQAITERFEPRSFIVSDMGPSLATHAGPGGILIAF